MKKRLLAVAAVMVGAIVVLPAAQASGGLPHGDHAHAAPLAARADTGNVTISGRAGVAIEAIDLDNRTGADFQATQVNNNDSALIIKGWESLGNGLKAVFLMDMFVGLDSGASGTAGTLLGRGDNGYVGLAGNFGTVALGFHGRPWKASAKHVDLFHSTIADFSAIMGTYNPSHDHFHMGIRNSVIWFLPNMSGFSGHLQWGADEADNNSNDWGAQFNYTNGPFYVTASYDENGRASGAHYGDTDIFKLAATWTFMEATTVTAMWEAMDIAAGTMHARDRDAWYLGLAHTFGNNTAKLAYADADAALANDGADYWAIGLDHSLSKRTTVYALYTRVDNDSAGTYKLTATPHTSSYTTGAVSVGAGADMDAFAVGIKHYF